MIAAVRRALQPLLFTPGLVPWNRTKARKTSRQTKARPFWGFARANAGGPNVRTRRMIAEFGNYWCSANVIYAQSAWSAGALRSAIDFRKRYGGALIVNQNGWYYPGWYDGDWQRANDELVAIQKAADYVLYQSEFCREAGRALTGFVPARHEVLHNAVPGFNLPRPSASSDGRTCWLSSVFTPDSRHVVEPALRAFRILRHRMDKRHAPRVLIAGRLHKLTMEAPWFADIRKELSALEADGGCEWVGEYRISDLPKLMSRADIALHLRYKDSCPNAVIERMALGMPHVYSNSGGTPELVGDAGIGLTVEDTWDRQVAVDTADLAGAIEAALSQRSQLSEAAIERSRLFSWERYVARHREVFASALADSAMRCA